MAKGESKIAAFVKALNSGLTREEAMKKTGVSLATSRTQYYKWQKAKKDSDEEVIEDEE